MRKGARDKATGGYTWQPPNIRALPGAVWQHRDRAPGGEWDDPTARTDIPKQRIRSIQGDRGKGLISEYRPPANVGNAFYAYLRKRYAKGAGGDYA